MTERNNSNEESGWTSECFSYYLSNSYAKKLKENISKFVKPSPDVYHSRSEDDNQPQEERSKINSGHYSDEITEQFANSCATSDAIPDRNSSIQNHNFTNTLPNVENILPQGTNTNFTPLQGSEGNYNSWIQSNELAEERGPNYRFDDSSFSNCTVNYFYCPICSYRSLDRSQIQNHYYGTHGENTNSTNCQAPITKNNSYIGTNFHMEGAFSDEFMENTPRWSKETTTRSQSIEATFTRAWESEKSTQSSTMSTNTINATLIPSKHVDPEW
nr:hypothetical protein HmN_001005000 [Hymenolepis microstoma]